MNEQQITQRIQELCETRGWSLYRLAKESGITYSTLCTMLHKANAPSMSTLIKLCAGFGISLSDFFETGAIPLSHGEKILLAQWRKLTHENRLALLKYMDFLLTQND